MWWQSLGSLIISAIGLAVGANWLASASARRVSALKAHADLLVALPASEGKNRLAEYLDSAVQRHVAEFTVVGVRRKLLLVRCLMILAGGLGVAQAVILAMTTAGGRVPSYLTWVLLLVSVILGGVMSQLTKKAGTEADELIDQNIDQTVRRVFREMTSSAND